MFSIQEVGEILKSLFDVRDEIVPCILGEPGIGKTQSVYALRDWVRENTEFSDCKVVEMIASTILPSEVSGITMPDKDSRSLDIYDHRKLSSLKDGDILFFDELLQGSDQTLKACLTLVMERRMMSGKKLPDIMIVAASNPKSYKTLEPSIRQRFLWIDAHWDVTEYVDYLLKHDVPNPERLAALVDFDTDRWNIQTPRTIFKMMQWVKHDDRASGWLQDIFSLNFASNIEDALKHSVKDLSNRKIIETIAYHASPYVDSETLSKLEAAKDMAEVMAILEEQPNWDKISTQLSTIMFDEKTGDFKEEGESLI